MVLGIITGDIVASKEMDAKDKEQLYEDLYNFLKQLHKEKTIEQYELFRGDSLQYVVKEVQQSLRVALMTRAFVKSYVTIGQRKVHDTYQGKGKMAVKGYFPGKQDIRLSVGIGSADFRSKRLGHSDGEGFYLSGEGLDGMKGTSNRLVVKTNNESINEEIEAPIMLLDAILEKWTNNQAELVLYALKGYTEDQIKNKLKITQPAVSQRKKTSQWYAIEKFLSHFEKLIKKSYQL